MNRGTIFACGRCGQWLDNEASRRLVLAELPDASHEILRPQAEAGAATSPYRTAEGETTIACPECKAALAPYTTDPAKFGVAVRLDVCAQHGTWFDHGEAWSLLQAIALRRGALDVQLEGDLSDAAWAAHERAWQRWVIRRF
jgi:hypothetical protein